MKSIRFYDYVLIVLAVLLILYLNTPASEDDKSVSYGIQTLSGSGGFTEYQKSIMNELKRSMKSKGYELTDKPDIQIFLSVLEKSDELITAVNFILTLPKEIVELGGNEEAFYAALKSKPKEDSEYSHEVRKYISEEYLSQFGMIQDSFITVHNKNDISGLVKDILERLENNKPLNKQ